MKKFGINTQEWKRTVSTVMSAVVLGAAVEIQAGRAEPGVVPVHAPRGGFGIDGDPAADAPEIGVGDWTSLFTTLQGADSCVLDSQGLPVDAMVTCLLTEPTGLRKHDGVFAAGGGWADDPNTWRWVRSTSSPEKSNLRHGWLHVSTDDRGHLWLIIGASRASAVGSACIDVELLQNKLEELADGTFRSYGPHGGRTVNDLLMSLAFGEGGKELELTLHRWEVDGRGGFGYAELSEAAIDGRAFAAVNNLEVRVADGRGGSVVCAPNEFCETAVDLTAMLGAANPCAAQSLQTMMLRTRTSGDRGGALADYLEPLQQPVRVANAGADQRRLAERTGTSFTLSAQAADSLYPIAAASWSVVDGDVVIESPESRITDVRVSSISATLRFTVEQENGCVFSDEVALTVLPPLLDIRQTAPGQLTVRWPVVPQNYVLEISTDSGLAEWNAYEGPMEEQDGYWQTTFPNAGSQQLFRLRGQL